MKAFIQWCNENQGFLSAILSAVAVFAAISIPAFIARRQNKIALFEKKYEAYSEILKFICFANQLEGLKFIKHPSDRVHVSQVFDAMKKPNAILYSMSIIFGFKYEESIGQNEKLQLFLSEIKRSEHRIYSSLFLFSNLESSIIERMISTCQDFIYYVINVSRNLADLAVSGGDDETARAFILACGRFSPKQKSKIEKDLLL